MSKNFRTLAAIGFAAALTLPAISEAGQRMQQTQMRGAQQQAGQQAQKIHTIRGQLVDVRQAQLRQDPSPHVLARVRTNTGRTAVIDLGQIQDLRNQDVRLRRNQQIEAQGLSGRINRQPVLVVERFRTQDGQLVQLDRQRQQQQAQRFQQQRVRQQARVHQPQRMSPQQQARFAQQRRAQQAGLSPQQQAIQSSHRTIRGEVTAARNVKLQGEPNEHRLIKVRQDDGQTAVIDLGEEKALEGLQLEKGERVVVRGTSARINDRPVLVAREVAQVAYLDRGDFLSDFDQGQQRNR